MTGHTTNAGGWMTTLTPILREHNGKRANGDKASDDTRRKRGTVLMQAFAQLREGIPDPKNPHQRKHKFRLDDVRQFKGKHMQALVNRWVSEGLSSSVIQNRISIFRVFCEWIGKHGMILPSIHYVTDPKRVTRSSIATSDKSWSARGIDPVAVMERVRQIEPWVAMVLILQWTFGLRVRESVMFRPWLADLETLVDVTRGTKGGRQRIVKITDLRQRAALDEAKAFVSGADGSIAPEALSLKQARNRFYAVLRKAGVTRKNGMTAHGLRHEFAHAYFEAIAGYASPVRGGPKPADKAVERHARLEVAESLGHSRESITTHYLGR